MQPHAQKRLRLAAFVALPRGGDQRAQAVQQAHRLSLRLIAVRGERQAGAQLAPDFGKRQRPRPQRSQQVHEHLVPAQLLGQRDAPLLGVEIARDGRAEEQLVLRLQVALRIGVAGGIHALGEVRLGRDVGLDDGGAEQLVDALAFFAQDGVFVEGLAEHVRRVLAQFGAAALVAHRGGGADADQPLLGRTLPRRFLPRHFQPFPQPPDKARQIGALRPVEGVQFVHHQIAQRAGLVVPPKPPIRRADHQEIQHLVVGEQDVRRAFAQRLPIRDQMLPPHRGVRRLLALADVQASAHLAAQRRRIVDDLGDAPRLIERQGVHRIDEDGLHALLPGMAPAVIQNRPQEALRLPRPRARGHDGGTPAMRGAGIKPLVRDALMAVRREAERDFRERLATFGRQLGWERDGEVGALEEVLLLGEEVVQHMGEGWV